MSDSSDASARAQLSVVMPAHDEEHSIRRSLTAMLKGSRPGEMEVIVVCNGCSDETATVARAFSPDVDVIELPEASKSAALNHGDQQATCFPRFYVDADVEVSAATLRELAAVLRNGETLAASVRPELILDDCSWPVRSYYRIWSRLPQLRDGLSGAGLYGLAREGRSRFVGFPELVADDMFVTSLFRPGERARLNHVSTRVRPARSFRDLLATRVRVHLGNLQIRRSSHGVQAAAASPVPGWFRVVCAEPRLLAHLPAYLVVTAWAKLEARHRIGNEHYIWERAARTAS